jgi:RNA polymerase sigma factor (sigma-70 family)
MSLHAVSDRYLAARAAEGDGFAFAELARRYRRLIWAAAHLPPPGLESEDLRQEALLGLLVTCQNYDPAKGAFAALARRNVRRRVSRACVAARARKHLVLSDAMRDGDDPMHHLAERAAAPEGAEPGRVVELRDELRQRARPRSDRRRRYSDEQIARALELLAEGRTIKETAFAVGASCDQIRRWAKRADQPHGGRRRFTPSEISAAIELVHGGATLREAGAAVGASKVTVLKWIHKAA